MGITAEALHGFGPGVPHLDVIVDPVVDMVSGDIAGIETLHLCSPTSAPTMGQWRRTLLQTLMTSVRWKQRGQIPRQHFCITDLSWERMNHPDLVRSVQSALSGSGEDPRRLQLRLDSALLRSAEDKHLDTLVELGETGLGLLISGAYAPLHAQRHHQVLDIDYVMTPVTGPLAVDLPGTLERIAGLDLKPIVTNVNTMEDQFLAVAAGARMGLGDLYRSGEWIHRRTMMLRSQSDRDKFNRYRLGMTS